LAEVSEADESNGSAANDRLLWLSSSRPALRNTYTDGVIDTVVSPAARLEAYQRDTRPLLMVT
jgi:hypothetical protein